MHDMVITINSNVEFGGVSAKELRLEGKVLVMGVADFCQNIVTAARSWIIASFQNENVQKNLPLLVRYRPQGLPPFAIGVPVIAGGPHGQN
jgi:hypothetical protein